VDRVAEPEPAGGAATALGTLRGVGPALAEKLGKLGVQAPADLLFLLPQRYEDRTRLRPIGSVRPGSRVVVEGDVVLADVVFRRRRALLVRIADGSGQLTLRFFYFSSQQRERLTPGSRVRCFGEVRAGPLGAEMVHPEYRLLAAGVPAPLPDRLTPVYPVVEGLTQPRLRDLVHQVLSRRDLALPDYLAPALAALPDAPAWPALGQALQFLHEPPAGADLARLATGTDPCQRRLAAEEMLAHYLALRGLRAAGRQYRAVPLPRSAELTTRFLAGLGFALTPGQRSALADIDADLAEAQPMMRLVQGDVGSGKTVVAAVAALQAVAAGCQAAIMAPTELLAEQHRKSFERWFRPLGIDVGWLSGSMPKRLRESTYKALADGTVPLVVGTHALFQAGLEFHRLALIIVDEQHRFGVQQRLRLMEKGTAGTGGSGNVRPHQLVLTATPIPRTLAMTMYADLDTSVIRGLPPGRTPVATVALPDRRRPEVVQRVRDACQGGARAYWVCPLIEESEEIPSQAAEATAAELTAALPGISVGLVHGRMTPDQKERAMQAFTTGKVQLLVATTVIEVGVDVPEATLMIIENAERMGLSQLHQLRGRVGRGAGASTCVLLYRSPLSPLARERLDVLRATNDGFEVAQRDLELRGPGEVLGTRQTGLMQLRVADLVRDADLAPLVQQLGATLLAGHPAAVAGLRDRWIGPDSRYRDV
jgi:ATP-dependent DNA helicase RecG